MGRYREPQPVAAKYITKEGFQALETEYHFLWRKKRPAVTNALAAAAAEGDRSENAEYIYRKKELREIDRRVRYLQKRLDQLVIVDTKPTDQQQIYFGAWVVLEKHDGDTVKYRIVGPDEFDIKKGYISMDSPLAKALMKKRLADEIVVNTPSGRQNFIIQAVNYL